jgi:hypothetical protein
MGAPLVFGGPLSPLGWKVGFLREAFPRVRRATLDWKERLARDYGQGVRVADLGNVPLLDALRTLDPLQTPPKKELLVGTRNGWTAHFMNSHLGGDSVSWTGALSGALKCAGVLAAHVPVGQYPYPATQFELLDPTRGCVRALSCGKFDSGRWQFLATGDPQPFEETAPYGAKRIRDRFDRPRLLRYLAALGIEVDDPSFWGEATRLEQLAPFEPRESTVAETRRKYGIRDA